MDVCYSGKPRAKLIVVVLVVVVPMHRRPDYHLSKSKLL